MIKEYVVGKLFYGKRAAFADIFLDGISNTQEEQEVQEERTIPDVQQYSYKFHRKDIFNKEVSFDAFSQKSWINSGLKEYSKHNYQPKSFSNSKVANSSQKNYSFPKSNITPVKYDFSNPKNFNFSHKVKCPKLFSASFCNKYSAYNGHFAPFLKKYLI